MARPRPTWYFPNCGSLLQARLGCRGAPAFSLEAACSGFIYALAIADKFVRAGESKRALVVGSEVLSRITDYSDRSTAILFGDGAGAVVLAPSEQPGIISTHLHADGSYQHLLYCTGGPARGPAPGTMAAGRLWCAWPAARCSSSRSPCWAASSMRRWQPIIWIARRSTGWCRTRPTCASSRRWPRSSSMPMERVIVTVQEHGNTSTASVPLALDVGVRDGRIKRGDLLLLEALGGGVTWGSALLRY